MRKNKIFLPVQAFSFVEVLVTLLIISILIMLALPNLMPLISKTKSMEAQMQLDHLYNLEKNYFFLYSKYCSELNEISFEHAKLVKDGGTANYRIEIIEATDKTFKASATAVTDFDGDGIFNTWEVDQDKRLKEVVAD